MISSNVAGLILAAFGAWLMKASRGAYSWDANTWRISGDTSQSWFAMLVGPRILGVLYVVLGLLLVVTGLLLAFGIV